MVKFSITVSDPSKGQMNRLPDRGLSVPEGAQGPSARWAVHRTKYCGRIRAHQPVNGWSAITSCPRVHVRCVLCDLGVHYEL